ncbi:MAG TPA: thiamine diphosphokinase [Candidatus Scatosoma pullicola]|nr:thiamine diphosphokinase [Candidatus Scatosoma pullicola]
MKGIILLNGDPYRGEIDGADAWVVCADGAFDWAEGKVRIDENIGDFDSAKKAPYPPPAEIYPSVKDYTDGEIALERILALFAQGKIDRAEIYGGGGRREDHFLGNIHLLYRACREGLPCTMFTNGARLFARTGKFRIENILQKTVSLLPLGGEAHILYNKGLFYPTDGLTLTYGSCRGISNVGTAENAEVFCDRGYLLAVVNEDPAVTAHAD